MQTIMNTNNKQKKTKNVASYLLPVLVLGLLLLLVLLLVLLNREGMGWRGWGGG